MVNLYRVRNSNINIFATAQPNKQLMESIVLAYPMADEMWYHFYPTHIGISIYTNKYKTLYELEYDLNLNFKKSNIKKRRLLFFYI